MAAVVHKNEPLDTARSVEVNVFASENGAPADPDTDLTGYVYVSRSTYKYVPATGVMVNKRHTLGIAADVVDAVVGDTATMAAHNYRHGDGPFVSDKVIGSVAIGAGVWIIWVDANTVAFASSLANAYANIREVLTGAEVGAAIGATADTERGIRGKWQYTFALPETDIVACELSVAILGHSTFEGGASVNFDRGGSSLLDESLEGDVTVGDGLRAVVRGELAPYTDEPDGTQTVMSLDGTKPSHKGTVTESGRSGMAILDLSP